MYSISRKCTLSLLTLWITLPLISAQPSPSRHLLDIVQYPEGFNLGIKKPDSFKIWVNDTFSIQVLTRTETYKSVGDSTSVQSFSYSMHRETGTPASLGKFIQLESHTFPIFPGELHITRQNYGKYFIYDTLYSISIYKPYDEDFYIYENGTYVKTVRIRKGRVTFMEALDLSNTKRSLRYEFYKQKPYSLYSLCKGEVGKGNEIVYFDRRGKPFSDKKATAENMKKEKQLKRMLKRYNIPMPNINNEPPNKN